MRTASSLCEIWTSPPEKDETLHPAAPPPALEVDEGDVNDVLPQPVTTAVKQMTAIPSRPTNLEGLMATNASADKPRKAVCNARPD